MLKHIDYYLAGEVYKTGREKYGVVWKEGDKIDNKYKILALEDNQNNVMQAMAVALVNERGEETREKAVKSDMRSLVFIIN